MHVQPIFLFSALLAIAPLFNLFMPMGQSDVLAYRGSGRIEMAYRGSGRIDTDYRGSGRIEMAYRGSGRLAIG